MKDKTKKIDPKEYAEILAKTELVDIYLESCSVNHDRIELQAEKKIKLEIKDKVTFRQVDVGFIAITTYEIKAIPSDPQKVRPIMTIKATFCLHFKSQGIVGKPFLDVFKVVNLPLNSWPYLREFVQNIVQRMNLPPLVLPFARRNG
jgi:preprotein translocase subunit SecB